MINIHAMQATGEPYDPVEVVEVPANTTETVDFNGYTGDRYGIFRILPYSTEADVTITALRERDKEIFVDVLWSALEAYYRDGVQPIPEIIEASQYLRFRITNNSSNAATVTLALQGMRDEMLEEYEDIVRKEIGRLSKADYLYATDTVAASAVRKPIRINKPAAPQGFKRFGVATSGQNEDFRARLTKNNDVISGESTLVQWQDINGDGGSLVPYTTERFSELELEVSSDAPATQRLSVYTVPVPKDLSKYL
jgi:hypothetical protein